MNNQKTKKPDTSKSIHLSASAGSGKTRALKERYLALLDVLDNRGLNIDQAVAITFTDKAAAEIKERVMHDLPEAMLKKIIRGRQDLRISTIHSFCMNLLKRYPLEAGLPPDFGVLDSRDQTYKIQQAIEEALEESDGSRELMAPLSDFTADELISAVEFLLSIRSRLKRMEIDAGGPEGLLRAVRTGMQREQTEAELNALIVGNDWRTGLQEMELILRSQGDQYDDCRGKEHLALSGTKDIHAAFRILRSLASIYMTGTGSPRKNPFITKKLYNGNRSQYEKLYSRIQDFYAQFQSLYARMQSGQEAESLLMLFQRAEGNYQNLKLREGLLDFDDLEIYAYGLLQGLESPDILYWLDRKILHFLVDEFQDTSDIQWAILNKLTEEIFAGQGADKVMTPTLFVVGDAKQSIYRFREANYRLIENVRRKLEQNLPAEAREIVTLDKNYRSTPEIMETANKVFTALWQENYQPSEVERKEHRGSIRLIELPPASSEQSSCPHEAEVLAAELKTLIEEGVIVYEKNPEAGGWIAREADYGDCAILIQSRTRLKEYETALQAATIPYRVIGGIGFYEEDEIQALLNVLFFLWNHDDILSLAAALKSPLFALDEQEIYDLMRHDAGMVGALKQKRPDLGILVQGWINLSGLIPLATLLHRIIHEGNAYIRFGRRNAQAIYNIDKLLDTAREFDRRGYTTLQDFVEWVRNIRRTEQREATADMNLPGFHGSVSIMTVHKAKGLEYPVVFLPGMNQQPRSLSSGPPAIVEDRNGTVQLAVRDAVSPVYDELWERERGELIQEHQRLLYVAMTRARDHLVMLGTLREGNGSIKPNSWLSYLHQAAPSPLFEAPVELPSGMRLYAHPAEQEKTSTAERGEKKSMLFQEHADKAGMEAPQTIDVTNLIRNLSPIPRSESLAWKSATDFITRQDAAEKIPALEEMKSVSPLVRGSVLHRCLEEVTVSGKAGIEGIAEEYPEIRALDQDDRKRFIDEISSVLGRVLNETALAWIFERGPHAYSELPFLYRKDQALVSGIIDRVIIQEGKGIVIDYKAILIKDSADLKSWLDHYRPQLQLYCEAVKEMFRLPKVKGYVLFLDSTTLARCTEI